MNDMTEEQKKVIMDGFLKIMGLGPRECDECGEIFTPPPYDSCKKVKLCQDCGMHDLVRRFSKYGK